MALRHVGEECWTEEPAARWQVAGGLPDLRTLGNAARHELTDALHLCLGVDRADVGVLIHRVADAQHRHAITETGEELVGDRLLHQEAAPGAADLALVEEDAVDDTFDRLVERSVFEDDVGRLPTELKGEALPLSGDALGDRDADRSAASKGDLGDARVGDDRHAGAPGAGNDIDDAVWEFRLTADIGEEERGERRC